MDPTVSYVGRAKSQTSRRDVSLCLHKAQSCISDLGWLEFDYVPQDVDGWEHNPHNLKEERLSGERGPRVSHFLVGSGRVGVGKDITRAGGTQESHQCLHPRVHSWASARQAHSGTSRCPLYTLWQSGISHLTWTMVQLGEKDLGF